MRFDARTAKQLLPGAHLNIDGCPGLRLEATASRRSWIYRYKSPVDGRMRQIKIGEWPAVSIAGAAVEWERLRDQRNAGNDPALSKRQALGTVGVMVQQGDSLTVGDVCAAYLKGHVEHNRKSKGAVEVARMFRTMIGDIAETPAAELTRERAFAKIDSFRHIPVQASKLRLELGAAWDYALDAGKLPESSPNWWRQIMQGRIKTTGRLRAGERTKEKRVLSDDELTELLAWLPHSPQLLQDAISLYLWTGTRGAEIMAIEGSEITKERDGTWWTIPKAKTKNANVESATDHRVPLVGRALEIVTRRKEQHGSGYLFPAKRAESHTIQKTIQEMIYRCQPYGNVKNPYHTPKLTVTHCACHDLRRTVRTMLARLGCPHEVAEAIIGHVLGGVAGVYNRHRYDNERREWLTKLDAELCRLAGRRQDG